MMTTKQIYPPVTEVTVTREQLKRALKQWEQDARDGKTMSVEESRSQSLEVNAEASTVALWAALGGS